MHKNLSKRKPVKHFSVLVIPRDSAHIRRLEISKTALKWLIGGISTGAVVVVGLFAGFLFYRHAFNAGEQARIEAAGWMRERTAVESRVGELETSLSRTMRFLAKIESALDRKKGEAGGQGPVDEEDWLPSGESASHATPISRAGGGWHDSFSKVFTKGLDLTLGALSAKADSAEEHVHALFAKQQDGLFFWASLPSIWPSQGWVTSEFGSRRGWGGHRRFHEGIDIAGSVGTPVTAPGDGTVTYTGYRGGYGRVIAIDHGYGISTVYAHCSALYVNEGQRVKRGMIIGTVGNTGRSTGSHLHYEVHVDGMPVDPLLYVMQ